MSVAAFSSPPLPLRTGDDQADLRAIVNFLFDYARRLTDHFNEQVKVTSDGQDTSIQTNAEDIATNVDNIQTNAEDIATNVTAIAANVTAIAALDTRLTAAEATLVNHEERITALEGG